MASLFQRIGITTLFLALTAGCVAPKIVPYQTAHRECQLVTKELTLTLTEFMGSRSPHSCTTQGCEALILGYAGGAAISLALSGSVVVVGNTLHWIEKEGSCDDSTTHNLVNHFTEELVSLGGILVNSITDISELFTQE